MLTLVALVTGMLAMGYGVAGLFFFQFWRRTSDRLFAYFAVAFWLLSFQRIVAGLTGQLREGEAWLYSIRLLAFLLIIAGVLEKNRARR
jgi:hypothetical protein